MGPRVNNAPIATDVCPVGMEICETVPQNTSEKPILLPTLPNPDESKKILPPSSTIPGLNRFVSPDAYQSNPAVISENILVDPKKIESAVTIAIKKFYDYIESRNDMITDNVRFGPNFDKCYHWRLGAEKGDTYGDDKKTVILQKQKALEAGLPDMDNIPDELRFLLNIVNYSAREDNVDQKKALGVLKHFPGGDWIELTETQLFANDTPLEKAIDTFMKPFLFVLKENPPKGIMLSHVRYSMESEILQNHPELKEFYLSQDKTYPASLSPAMVRGMLRGSLGYKGLIVGDWYNMSGVVNFVSELNDTRYGLKGNGAKLVIMAVMAGVNWVPAVSWFGQGDRRQISDLYETDDGFKARFDDHIAESFFLLVKNSDHPETMGLKALELDDLKADNATLSEEKVDANMKLFKFINDLTLDDKLSVLMHESENPIIKNIQAYYLSWTDVWNRQGILTMKFMVDVISGITAQKYPDPPLFRKDELAWVGALMKDKEFVRFYKTIDWGSPEMLAIYKHALDNFTKKDVSLEAPESK